MTFRICASLILKNQAFYQSFKFEEKRFLGSTQSIYESLERKKIDEIHIIRCRKDDDDFEEIKADYESINSLISLTPIAIGGGLSKSFNINSDSISFERFLFNKCLFSDISFIQQIKDKYGMQSICAYIPLKLFNDETYFWNGSNNSFEKLEKDCFSRFENHINEFIFLDCMSEGTSDGFNFKLLKDVTVVPEKILISGGINRDSLERARKLKYAGVSIENRCLFYEDSFINES